MKTLAINLSLKNVGLVVFEGPDPIFRDTIELTHFSEKDHDKIDGFEDEVLYMVSRNIFLTEALVKIAKNFKVKSVVVSASNFSKHVESAKQMSSIWLSITPFFVDMSINLKIYHAQACKRIIHIGEGVGSKFVYQRAKSNAALRRSVLKTYDIKGWSDHEVNSAACFLYHIKTLNPHLADLARKERGAD